jgi:hypothetical protein
MSSRIVPPDFRETEGLLTEFFEEVKKWESPLAGGTRLSIGASAIESLLQSRVSFGNPTDQLKLLKEDAFREVGVELTNDLQRQILYESDFYYMTLPVYLRAKPTIQFRQLCCELNFSPKGDKEPIIQKIFPAGEWRTMMQWGVGMNLALNESLDWTIGIDASEVAEMANLPGEMKASVANKSELKAYVIVPDYTHELGQSEVFAQGEGSSTCYWYIQKPELTRTGTVLFTTVFKVPKGTELVNLHAIAWAEPDMKWLTTDIRDVFSELAERFKDLLRLKQDAAKKLSTGRSEEWRYLKLPK